MKLKVIFSWQLVYRRSFLWPNHSTVYSLCDLWIMWAGCHAICPSLVSFFCSLLHWHWLTPLPSVSPQHVVSFWPRAALCCVNTGLSLHCVCVCVLYFFLESHKDSCAHMPLPPPLLHLLPSPTLSILSNRSTNITPVLLATTFPSSQSQTSWQHE